MGNIYQQASGFSTAQFERVVMPQFDHSPNIMTIQSSDSVGDVDSHVMPMSDMAAIGASKKIAVLGCSNFHGNWADPQAVMPMTGNDCKVYLFPRRWESFCGRGEVLFNKTSPDLLAGSFVKLLVS